MFRLTFTEAFVSNICREKQRSAIRVKLWFRVILRGVDKETEFSEKACSIIQNLCLFWRAPPRLHPHRARLSHAPFCHFCFLSLFNLPFPSSCAAPSAVLHFLSCNQCGVLDNSPDHLLVVCISSVRTNKILPLVKTQNTNSQI